MAEMPELKRVPYSLYTCQMRGCNRQAAYFSHDNKWKLCTFHMGLVSVGNAAAKKELDRRTDPSFDLSALGELDEHGNIKHSGEPQKGDPSTDS